MIGFPYNDPVEYLGESWQGNVPYRSYARARKKVQALCCNLFYHIFVGTFFEH